MFITPFALPTLLEHVLQSGVQYPMQPSIVPNLVFFIYSCSFWTVSTAFPGHIRVNHS